MQHRIAVIGAGIIGCLSAREICDRFPKAQVVLIDRDLVGLGASQRSAGVHFPIGRTERVRAMASFSERYYAQLAASAPQLPFQAIDLYAVASDEAEDTFRATLVTEGMRVSPPNNQSLLPWPQRFVITRMPGCNYIDVGTLARFTARELRGRVTLLEGVAVELLVERAGGVEVVLSSGDTLCVERVVLTPGPWVNAGGWRELTAPLGARIKKVVAFHIEHPIAGGAAGMFFAEEDAFIVPMSDRGYWLYSYTCTEWDVAPDEPRPGISDLNRRAARDVLQRYAPDSAPEIRAGRVFCDAYSPTREPVIAALGHAGNIVFAGAANGSGYRLGPAIAAEAAQLLN